jgi:hypothetical protein
MSRNFLTPINLNQLELQNAQIQNLATAPSSPVLGQIYFDTIVNAIMVWNGASWANLDATKLSASIPNSALITNPLARANHTGTQTSSSISDLSSVVHAYTLDSFAAPVANISLNSNKITNLATPTISGDAAEYSWVLSRPVSSFATATANIAMGGFKLTGLGTPSTSGDSAEYSWVISQIQSAAAGISSKNPVRLVTTSNVSLSGLAAIDDVTPIAGDRILVTGQTTTTTNGVYNAASGLWTRTTIDGPAPGEIEAGALWLVTEGTVNAGSQWRVNTTGTITIGSTSISIVQFGATSVYSAGDGISLTGSTFSVNPSSGILVGPGGVYVDTSIVATKYSTTIGDGSSTSYVVTHSLGTRDVLIQVKQTGSPYGVVECDMSATTTNTSTIVFASAPSSNAYRVTIIG